MPVSRSIATVNSWSSSLSLILTEHKQKGDTDWVTWAERPKPEI